MKCIHCGRDSRKKDRPERRCPGCRHEFAFEPTQGDRFTDPAFQSAIDAVSDQGQLRWGVEHLYYELARRRLAKQRPGAIGCGLLALVLFGVGFAIGGARDIGGPALVCFGLALLALVFAVARARAGRAVELLPLEAFDALWARWLKVHERPPSVIARRDSEAAPRDDVEPDLGDYSFDRVVVCDRARTVDLLLANDFHFENNCAVLSITGYPQSAFETVRAMLRRNPKLEVYALHDATPFGCRVAHRLQTDPEWFAAGQRVKDVGLRPAAARSRRSSWLAAEVSDVSAGNGISAAEARWLARYRLELAALKPRSVLRQLFQAITGGEGDEGADSQSFG